MFCFVKIGIFCKSIKGPLSEAYLISTTNHTEKRERERLLDASVDFLNGKMLFKNNGTDNNNDVMH